MRRGGKRGRKRIRGNLWVSPPSPRLLPTHVLSNPSSSQSIFRSIYRFVFFFLRESGCVLLHEEGNCKLHFTHARSRRSCKKRVDITLLTPIFLVFVRGKRRCVCPMRCFLRRHPTPPHSSMVCVIRWRRLACCCKVEATREVRTLLFCTGNHKLWNINFLQNSRAGLLIVICLFLDIGKSIFIVA